jgi:hypothetical protein
MDMIWFSTRRDRVPQGERRAAVEQLHAAGVRSCGAVVVLGLGYARALPALESLAESTGDR